MKFILGVILVCIFFPIIFLIAFTPEPCEHNNTGMIFSFQPEKSTAYSYYRPYCKECSEKLGYTNFKGSPNNQSYLGVLEEHCGGSEIVAGEYYTVTVIVTSPDTDYFKTKIRCKVQNEDYIVSFSVEFRDGFEELVDPIQVGDQITFRGRFYDEGCGFTDAELIIE